MIQAEHTAHLLALVLERSPRSVAELAAATGAAADQLGAALDALEHHGLLEWDGSHMHVRPGPGQIRFARTGNDRRDLAVLAEAAMQRLAEESGETVNVMVPTRRGAEAVAQVDGPHVLGASNWVGREVPDHCSAAGKLFLAFGVSTLPRGALERRTAGTITDRTLLERELDAARQQRFATIVDELEVGLAAVAAPIHDAGGAVVAALSVAGPTARLGPHRLALLGRVAIEQAHTVSTRLGYAGELEDLLDSLRARRV